MPTMQSVIAALRAKAYELRECHANNGSPAANAVNDWLAGLDEVVEAIEGDRAANRSAMALPAPLAISSGPKAAQAPRTCRQAILSERIVCAKIAAQYCQCRIHFDVSPHHFAECEAAQAIMLARGETNEPGLIAPEKTGS